MIRLVFLLLMSVVIPTYQHQHQRPEPIRATIHLRDISTIRNDRFSHEARRKSYSSRDNDRIVAERYRCAIFRVFFDQPLYASTVESTTNIKALGSKHHDVPSLFGSVRLICGNKVVESHPEDTLTFIKRSRELSQAPNFLLPLHESYDHVVYDLLRTSEDESIASGNTFVAAVVIDGDVSIGGKRKSMNFMGRRGPVVTERDLMSCEMRFLRHAERSRERVEDRSELRSLHDDSEAIVTNVAGDPVASHIKSFEHVDPPEASLERFRAVTTRLDRRHRWHQSQHAVKRKPKQKRELLNTVREKFKGEVSFDVTGMYSMLEVVTHAQETTVMEVEQFFEAIEDPLLNMLVPIVVQIAVDAMKPTLVGGLCMALPPVLATIFAMPTQMGMAGAGAAFDGGGLLGGLFGFLEVDEKANDAKGPSKRSWRRVDEIPQRVPTDSRGKKMYRPHATITEAHMSTWCSRAYTPQILRVSQYRLSLHTRTLFCMYDSNISSNVQVQRKELRIWS